MAPIAAADFGPRAPEELSFVVCNWPKQALRELAGAKRGHADDPQPPLSQPDDPPVARPGGAAPSFRCALDQAILGRQPGGVGIHSLRSCLAM